MIDASTLNHLKDWKERHMSKSLIIRCESVEQPAAVDPVEKMTWCRLIITIGGRTITRLWDKSVGEERTEIYIAAFPLIEWIVENWWALLNEPHRGKSVPDAASAAFHLPWIKRHCLRSASSSLLLPALYLYNDGRGVATFWQEDRRGTLPNMSGEFIESGSDHLTYQETVAALSAFVTTIFERVHSLNDERVRELEALRHAIQAAPDNEEAGFCITAGRMGLNPYDPHEVPDAVAGVIEAMADEPDVPWRRDLAEAAKGTDLAEQWDWVIRAGR